MYLQASLAESGELADRQPFPESTVRLGASYCKRYTLTHVFRRFSLLIVFKTVFFRVHYRMSVGCIPFAHLLRFSLSLSAYELK